MKIVRLVLLWIMSVVFFVPICQAETDRVLQTCQRIANKLSSVSLAECERQEFSILDITEKQTPLLLKTYPPLSRPLLGRVLLIGGIHGDEYSSVSVVFKWLNTLNRYHSGMFFWKIIPLLNPEGLLREKSQRTNQNGVDLNRNFPSSEQAQQHIIYWRDKTHSDPRRFPGEKPLSEKESQALVQLIKSFQPDVIVSVHAPYGIVDFDGRTKAPQKLGFLHLSLLGTYPGSLGRYGSQVIKIPVITIELKYAGIMPSRQQISGIWLDLVAWLKKYCQENSCNNEKN